ncbi:membrane protein [Streptosporangium violaceochromogenes]|nr:membrane protein [Streptosporangium violaceochromogenes]
MHADPRALRFSAAVTVVVLALVLVTGGAWLLAFQAVVFALGAFGASPYGMIFKEIVKSPPRELEDATPPRFAQGVGLFFALVGLIGYVTQITPLALGATAAALFAAFLNAAFGLCLGCEMFLIVRRLLPAAK